MARKGICGRISREDQFGVNVEQIDVRNVYDLQKPGWSGQFGTALLRQVEV